MVKVIWAFLVILLAVPVGLFVLRPGVAARVDNDVQGIKTEHIVSPLVTLAVFLSGRPMWVNREINAADAFVAAWLPGSEGGGVADVLLADARGKPRHDFTGRLSFSWPKNALQSPLNAGQPGYDPQFPLGFGLSYAKPKRTPALPEVSGLEVTKWLKEDDDLRSIPVVAVTAFAMKGDEEKIREGGCEAYIAKPISVTQFLETVRRFVG